MFLLVGLGNPGTEYAETRHNVGFMAVDEIVHRHQFSSFKSKFKGVYADGTVQNEKVIVLKPMTYMNLSGESVGALCHFFKIPTEKVIVFHDDMDLPVGKIKVKVGGGSGGHNGIKSIDSHIGNGYTRVRIGVSKPTTKEQVIDWVLSRFSSADRTVLEELITKTATELPTLLTKDGSCFMNKIITK